MVLLSLDFGTCILVGSYVSLILKNQGLIKTAVQCCYSILGRQWSCIEGLLEFVLSIGKGLSIGGALLMKVVLRLTLGRVKGLSKLNLLSTHLNVTLLSYLWKRGKHSK